jgi:hypothetical protein
MNSKNTALSQTQIIFPRSTARLNEVENSQRISIACFDHEIPPFVEAAMDKIYGSFWSSMAHFRVYGGVENASTYIVRKNDAIITIFLFRLEGNHVRILNEGIWIDEASVNRFASCIFSRFESVDRISFNAVTSTIEQLRFPYQQFNCTEICAVILPATPEEYLDGFGKSTRKNIKYYLKKLQKDFPSFSYTTYARNEVPEAYVRAIIQMHHASFANKNKTSVIDDLETERVVRLVRECGFVGVATIDGKICAGLIAFRIGNNFFSRIKAHDPQYDAYRFGILCSYLMIRECIALGGRKFDFGAGWQPHKKILQGIHRSHMHLTLYRSNFHMALNAKTAIRLTIRGYVHQVKLSLQHMESGQNGLARFVKMSMNTLRTLKRLKFHRT